MAKSRPTTTTTRIAPTPGIRLRDERGRVVPTAGMQVPTPLPPYWHRHLLDGACCCDDWAVHAGQVIAKGHGSRRSRSTDTDRG